MAEQFPRKPHPGPTEPDELGDVFIRINKAIAETFHELDLTHRPLYIKRMEATERVWGVVEPYVRHALVPETIRSDDPIEIHDIGEWPF